jgi:hypothetical protein
MWVPGHLVTISPAGLHWVSALPVLCLAGRADRPRRARQPARTASRALPPRSSGPPSACTVARNALCAATRWPSCLPCHLAGLACCPCCGQVLRDLPTAGVGNSVSNRVDDQYGHGHRLPHSRRRRTAPAPLDHRYDAAAATSQAEALCPTRADLWPQSRVTRRLGQRSGWAQLHIGAATAPIENLARESWFGRAIICAGAGEPACGW